MADQAFRLESPAFAAGGPIPARHTCDGENLSPMLAWTAPPPGTRSMAITMEDPDAPRGTFVHWIGWGLDPGLRELPEGAAPPFEGRNGFGRVGYAGPCPPPGHGPHHYVVRLHALAEPLDLEPGAARIDELREAVAVRLLQAAELVGTYERRR
jgi:Raf kinase inhibitor-like YbhB/YbcL family protein